MSSPIILALPLLVLIVAVSGPVLGGRVPVEYPEYAVENCIEGYVRVSYTHSEEGQPINIAILDASPEGIFEGATRKNLSYWRKPDQAGETEDVTIEYRLEDHDHCSL